MPTPSHLVPALAIACQLVPGAAAWAQPSATEPVAPAPRSAAEIRAGLSLDTDAVLAVDQPVMAGGAPGAAASTLAGAVGLWFDGDAVRRYRRSSSYARGSGQLVSGGASDGPRLSVTQEARVRPWGFEVMQLEVGEQLALDARPSLAERPDRWRRAYRGAGVDVEVIGMQWFGRRLGAQFLRIGEAWRWEQQRDDATGATVARYETRSDWAPFSFTQRRDDEELGRLDPIVMEGVAIDGPDADDGVVITTWYPRLTGLRLGGFELDAAYGRAAVGWMTQSVNGESRSIGSDDLPALAVPAYRGRVAYHGDLGDRATASVGAGIERGMHLTADAALVVEDRASGELGVTTRRAAVRATGFAARSDVWTSPTDVTRYLTGGGGVAAQVALRGPWRLAAEAEVARSFYATLTGDRGLRAELGARVHVGVQTRPRRVAALTREGGTYWPDFRRRFLSRRIAAWRRSLTWRAVAGSRSGVALVRRFCLVLMGAGP
jgi:hypothetical protein